jgi:hypothetical protein
MKKALVLMVILAALAAGFYYTRTTSVPITEVDDTPVGEQGRVMDIETYVSQNISQLSPEKEVLGGTFHVTNIETNGGTGVVSYEDGHNAYVADFSYEINDETGITMKSFVVRK